MERSQVRAQPPQQGTFEPMGWELVPAAQISLDRRAAVMNASYADYYVPIQVTPDQLAAMDCFYDVDLSRSVIALVAGKPAGMALLGFREGRAWIGGVGVAPAWRRRGLARAMMTHLIAEARGAAARQITLEVIVQNRPAGSLYASLGFRERRELLTWRRSSDADPLPIPRERLMPADPGRLLGSFVGGHDQPASWQREPSSLRKMASRLKGYHLDADHLPLAYCLVSGHGETVWLMDVGLGPGPESVTAGRILIQALAARYLGQSLSISNVSADSALNRVLAALGFLVTVRQWEMALAL